MTRRGGRGGSVTRRDLLLACVASLAVLALAIAGAERSRELTRERRAGEDRAVVSELAVGIALDLQQGIAGVDIAARDATSPTPIPTGTVPGAVSVSFVPAGTGSTGGAAAGGDDDVAAALDRARDSGAVVLTEPVEYGDAQRVLLVAAAYARDPRVGRPLSTADRRARLAGWIVAPVDLAALVRARLPEGAAGEARMGAVTFAATEGNAPERLPQQLVDVGGHHMFVRAGDPTGVGLVGPTIALLAAGALLAIIAAAVVVGVARRLREHEQVAASRTEQVRLIGEVAPLVQQSLELSDVLPSVAVQLSDHFALSGVTMSKGAGGPGGVELFSLGATPDLGVKAALRPPDALAAGETLALALQRGGRSVATLRLVAGRDLDAGELQSLRALTELVTAAIVNAALYASQQEAVRQLRELDALKTVFLGTASHELRTPATAISGFASLLTTSWERFDDKQRRDFADRIAANARSLSSMVQDLLDFSLLDQGTVSVTIEPLDLAALVESVVGRLAPMFTDHEIAFSAEPAPKVDADVNGLERVVTNLLTNAIKFSPSGTTVTVTAGPAGEGYGAQLVVSDQGPGIPEEERQQVFTRFYRGSGDAVVQTRGVGIGLSVVAELIARLRGEVLLDDAPGGGARFTVRLPASSSHPTVKEPEHASTP